MKALVIFNPTAGIKTKENAAKMVREKLESLGYQVDLFCLDRTFEEEIRSYGFGGVKLVVAVGGDGTVKVAAKTILANGLKAPLAIIPFGSANVIATALGLPIVWKKALGLLATIGRTTNIDAGLINNRHYFLVGFSVGYVSQVVTKTPRDLKSRIGFGGYLWKFIFNRIKMKKIDFKIKTRNKSFSVAGHSLIVFNALNFFGLKPKKRIDFNDGVFNLYVLTNKGFLTMVKTILCLLWFHRPPRHVFMVDDDYFQITLGQGAKTCQVDGDDIALGKNIEIRVLPKALAVVTR